MKFVPISTLFTHNLRIISSNLTQNHANLTPQMQILHNISTIIENTHKHDLNANLRQSHPADAPCKLRMRRVSKYAAGSRLFLRPRPQPIYPETGSDARFLTMGGVPPAILRSYYACHHRHDCDLGFLSDCIHSFGGDKS